MSELATKSHSDLLAAAALVLRAHQFDIKVDTLSESLDKFLLAENDLFIIGAVEFRGPEQLATLEGAATVELADRLGAAGAKRWDAYLVLLTDAPAADQEMSGTVADIIYNTRYLRRIVRWHLVPTEESLTSALSPFLPLASLEEYGELGNPTAEMLRRIPTYGVSREGALETYEMWRAMGGDVDQD